MDRKREKSLKKNRRMRNTGQARRRRKAKKRWTNADSIRQVRHWLLPNDKIFANVRFHGNVTWIASSLVILALCWSWSEARHVTDAFADAAKWCRILGDLPLTSYQGFIGALAKWTPQLMPVLVKVLQQRMAEIGAASGRAFYRIEGWLGIGFDGSRASAARTQSNEEELCAKNYGQGKTAKYRKKKSKGMRRKRNKESAAQQPEPQAWITMMWHMGLRLPWDWRLGPSNSSERDHVMDMIEQGHRRGSFPEKTLLCGDAGFIGYPLWSLIMSKNLNFLVRVGGNVSLLSEHATCQFTAIEPGKCGEEMFVLCWPKEAMRANHPPLELRLVRVLVGKTPMWLLTNVLDRKELSSKTMAQFYQMRWGVEVEFRGLKQTMDRAKLRCRRGDRLLAELNWSIFAMAVAELLALKEQVEGLCSAKTKTKRSKRERSPARISTPSDRSLAGTMRALRGCLKNLRERPQPGEDLASQLKDALTDGYQRTSSKKARYRPVNPDKKALGNPKVRKPDRGERRKLQEIACQNAA